MAKTNKTQGKCSKDILRCMKEGIEPHKVSIEGITENDKWTVIIRAAAHEEEPCKSRARPIDSADHLKVIDRIVTGKQALVVSEKTATTATTMQCQVFQARVSPVARTRARKYSSTSRRRGSIRSKEPPF
ncbi:MAG: hypothetical protein R2864_10330 [Syntrophotaleaceae bacterium]